jgi:WD40 repeat protein
VLKPAKTLTGHTGEVLVVAFSPNGKLLASAGRDRTVLLWDTETWKSRGMPSDHPGSIVGLAFSSDGGRLASVSPVADGCCVRVSDVYAAKQIDTLGGPQSGQWGVTWSPDGTRLATGGSDKTLRVWDVKSREEQFSVAEVCPRFIRGLAYSPTGDRIVVGGSGPTRLFDATTGEPIATEPMAEMCPTFLPSGGIAGWFHGSGRVSVYDLPSGKLRMTWQAHRTPVEGRGLIEGLAASPDGRFVASLGTDGVARIWSVSGSDPVEVATLIGHRGSIYFAAFSPDGKRLATAGKEDFTVRIWDLPPVCHVRK